jgi:hypothetical protein
MRRRTNKTRILGRRFFGIRWTLEWNLPYAAWVTNAHTAVTTEVRRTADGGLWFSNRSGHLIPSYIRNIVDHRLEKVLDYSPA